jgi:hypothetical protein
LTRPFVRPVSVKRLVLPERIDETTRLLKPRCEQDVALVEYAGRYFVIASSVIRDSVQTGIWLGSEDGKMQGPPLVKPAEGISHGQALAHLELHGEKILAVLAEREKGRGEA